MSQEIQQAFVVDGKIFTSKVEAQNYIRRPKIIAALQALKLSDALINLLVELQSDIEDVFSIGKLRVINKQDQKQIAKFHEALVRVNDPAFEWFLSNFDELLIRWKPQKRMSDEQIRDAAILSLTALFKDDSEAAVWLFDNKEAVLEAYKAGVEKRKLPEGAGTGLLLYRASKKAEAFCTENNLDITNLDEAQQAAAIEYVMANITGITADLAEQALQKAIDSAIGEPEPESEENELEETE